MPGYCVQGTVGHKILNGAKKIDFENRTSVEVNLTVEASIRAWRSLRKCKEIWMHL